MRTIRVTWKQGTPAVGFWRTLWRAIREAWTEDFRNPGGQIAANTKGTPTENRAAHLVRGTVPPVVQPPNLI